MPGDLVRVSIEREGRDVFVSLRTTSGTHVTLRAQTRAMLPLATNLSAVCLSDPEDDAEHEFRMRGDLEVSGLD